MKFTQEQVERELSDILKHGTREKISAGTGYGAKIVEGYFNPNDERVSPQFRTLFMQAVLDAGSPEVGDALWQKMCAMREASRPRPVRDADPIGGLVETIRMYGRSIEELVGFIADGDLSADETEKALRLLADIRHHSKGIEQQLNNHLAQISVESRRVN